MTEIKPTDQAVFGSVEIELGPVPVEEAEGPAEVLVERAVAMRRRAKLLRWAFAACEAAALLVAFLVSDAAVGATDGREFALRTALFAGTLPAWLALARFYRVGARLESRLDSSVVDEFAAIAAFTLTGTWLLYSLVRAIGRPDVSFEETWVFLGIALVLLPAAHVGALAFSRRRPEFIQNTVILGTDDLAEHVASKLLIHPEYGINVVGFVGPSTVQVDHLAYLGSVDELPMLVGLLDVERVVIASPPDDDAVVGVIRALQARHVHVDLVPRLFDVVSSSAVVGSASGFPLISLQVAYLSRTARALKRALDLVFSLVALLALSPAFAVIALLIKSDSHGPVFFRQQRMGAKDEPFHLYKFRTMFVEADKRKTEYNHLNVHARNGGQAVMFKIHNDPRVTRVGRLLRRHFVDELPQLINVLKGEMSLVGPRPLILEEDAHVQDWARRRLELKPGMTGLWQVAGRTMIPFEEMVKLDYLYVTNWSLWGDVSLLVRTGPLAFRGKGGEF